MIYAPPGAPGAKIQFKAKYDNFIGGNWVAPVKGAYFDVISPITGKVYTKAARSTAEDIELALDAAHAAADKWGRTPAAERANVLLRIADRLEKNLELLAYAETIDNGKPMRETLNADIPLAIWPAATTSSRPCSKVTTRCESFRKRSSDRCWP